MAAGRIKHGWLWGAVALLSACQAAPGGLPRPFAPQFRLQADAIAGATATAGQAAVPLAPGAGQPGFDGQLTVRFEHLLAKRARQLLATLADVDHLTIRLQGTGVDYTQPITRAQLTGGMVSFTFTGLPPVALTITIEALGSTGQLLGRDVQHVTVTAGQTTIVTSVLQLAPTIPNPRVIVAPSGGAGGSGGATGDLQTQITVIDNVPVKLPPIEAAYLAGAVGTDIGDVALHRDGSVWVTGGNDWLMSSLNNATAGQAHGKLYQISPTGQVTDRTPTNTPFDAQPVVNIGEVDTTDPNGRVVVTSWSRGLPGTGGTPDLSWVLGPDGVVDPTQAFMTIADATSDAGGRIWSVHTVNATPQGVLIRWDQTFTSIAQDQPLCGPQSLFNSIPYNTPYSVPADIAVDPLGMVWYAAQTFLAEFDDYVVIRRFNPESGPPTCGAQPLDVRVSVDEPNEDQTCIATDSQANLWYTKPNDRSLVKLSPSGAVLATVRPAMRFNAVYVDSHDHAWAYQGILGQRAWLNSQDTGIPNGMDRVIPIGGAADDLIARIAPDGTLLAYYHVGLGADLTRIAVAADGTMWAGTGSKGLLKLKVDVPFAP